MIVRLTGREELWWIDWLIGVAIWFTLIVVLADGLGMI